MWIKENDIEIYSTHSERKSNVAERFVKALRNKNYKHMTSISTNAYINNLNKRFNAYHKIIKIQPIYVRSNTYIDFEVRNKDKDKKFTVGGQV